MDDSKPRWYSWNIHSWDRSCAIMELVRVHDRSLLIVSTIETTLLALAMSVS